MEEIWKNIKGYEGKYQISNLGRVKSIEREYIVGNGIYHRRERILKQIYDRDKYLRVCLCKNNTKRNYFVHRLVAQAFIPNSNNLPQVNHKNENKSDNSIENLEWCTQIYNVNYGTAMQRASMSKCKKVNQYDLEGNFIKQWNSLKEISDTIKLNFKTISKCCLGERKTAFGYKWEYSKLKSIK